ncbi:MAG: hypothetical protein GW900_05275 [Gammaproteobacteria bacterium]|nr:hypothetical protein [Gammaproteobacteria bacterium]
MNRINRSKARPATASCSPTRQRGAVLFISLMFLIVLTLIGLSAANVGIMQERMAGNVRETNEAFQAAEATLREIEGRLIQVSRGGSGGFPATIPVWNEVLTDLSIDRADCSLSGIDKNSIPWETAPGTGNQYYLAELTDTVQGGLIYGSACRPMNESETASLSRYYVVIARARGAGGVGDVVLQSIFYYP